MMNNKPISAKQHKIDTIKGLISGKLKPSDLNDRLEIQYFDEGNIYLVNGRVVDEKQFIEYAKKEPAPGTLQFIKTNLNNDDEIYI